MPRKVLLADDSVTAQNMGRRILTDAGYEVVTVNNGSAALKKIHESRPDLVVLDVYMPGYGGLEVCQRLKESGETMRIPVLLSVGKMEPFKADEANRVRADGHIVKPFEAGELLAALTRLEDRIVPQAEAPRIRKPGKTEAKKSRFWHSAEPQAEHGGEAPASSDRSAEIARLAEIKLRQEQNPEKVSTFESEPVSETEVCDAETKVPEAEAKHVPAPAPAAEQDEAAPATFASAFKDAQAQPASEAVLEFSVAAPDYEKTELTVSVAADQSAPVEEMAPVALSAPAAPRWVAENVSVTTEEATLALEQEMQQAVSSSQRTEAPVQEAPVQIDIPVEAVAALEEAISGAAFAAVAAAGSGSPVNAIGNSALATEADPPEAEPTVPSEAAAAWENWRQVRDSVIAPQQSAVMTEPLPDPLAGSVAEIAEAIVPASDSTPSNGASEAPALDGAALAALVDSVLAGLKPKLMEEIAKKLSEKK